MSTGQYVSAESAYRNAMLLERDRLDWKLGLTQSVAKQGKFGEAVTLTQELIALDPDRADLWMLQANAYIGMNKPLAAAENYEIVDRMGQSTLPMLNTLGDIYVNEGLWELAVRAYHRALEVDPAQDPDRAIRNVEILAQRGAQEQASELLEQVRRVFGERLDGERTKRLLKLQVRMEMAEGADENAAQVLEEIVELDPLDGEALILLGQHYARTGDPDRAIFLFERAESLDDYESEAKLRHAQTLVEQGSYAEAVPLLKRVIEIEPRDDVQRYLEQVERVARSQG
jgi:tetratricopeptide (TPR) repeat protein